MQLSKSEYMLFLKHPAWLWLKKHAKHLLPPVDPALQARFDEGHAFEQYVEALYPGIVRLSFTDFDSYRTLPTRTRDAWRSGAQTVCQGRYEAGRTTCVSDILARDGDRFSLIEIKSGTKVKDEHVFDVAFQRVVLEEAGYPIGACKIAHVNNAYVRNGPIDPAALTTFADITDAVSEKLETTRARIDQALAAADSDTMPDPAPERAKLGSYDEWLEIRENLDPSLAADSIHRIPFMTAKTASALIEAGVTTIDQVEDPSMLGKSSRRYVEARARGGRVVDAPRLAQFLQTIAYPIYYLDYETTPSLAPPWDGVRPYQQVPFQYSLHVQRAPEGEIEHREYLHRSRDNPMPAFLERLAADIGDSGSILVWYAPFETARNAEMADHCPEFTGFLRNLNSRVVDLMTPFADETITDPAFGGSASIKSVLPALLPELSYDDLEIREGESAARLWKQVTLTDSSSAEREKVHGDLVAYCARDTWAMVEIHRLLREIGAAELCRRMQLAGVVKP